MNIGSVGSVPSFNIQALQGQPEAAETKKAGPDGDGDADEGGAAIKTQAPAPTVNENGQTVGQVINVTA